jgi:lysozyme
MNLKGIDVSEFNGNINFKKLKDEVDFVYIRATYGRYGIDKRFKEYTKGCIENNIPFSFYFYSYATSVELASDEVKFFLQMINPYKEKIIFPVAIDMEDSDGYKIEHGNPSKEVLTNICIVACEKISENKLTPIIYASADWFKNRLEEEKIKNYMKWIAWWGTDEKNIDKEKYQIWQHSSKGNLEAVSSKYVDLNYSFVDFITLKQYLLNVSKINFIKSKTLFSDLDIQYLSCYKWRSKFN